MDKTTGTLTVTTPAVKDIDGNVILDPVLVLREFHCTEQQARGLSADIRGMNCVALHCIWTVEKAL